MAFCIKRSDPDVTAALRRIARDQLDKALAAIDDPEDLHAAIHGARKKCKKLRGLIRLVRPGFADYAAENRALRDAARRLGPLRERGAGLETLDRITDARDDIDPGAAEAIRTALGERARAARADDLEARLEATRSDLAACRDRAAGWQLETTGFAALRGGLKKTYAKARKRMRAAQDSPTPEALHDWRKPVKYHWYHLRLLRKLATPAIEPRIAQARDLAAVLGDHQDLADFRALIGDDTLPAGAGAALMPPVAAEMSRFEASAFDLGQALFSDTPGHHLERWRGWWDGG